MFIMKSKQETNSNNIKYLPMTILVAEDEIIMLKTIELRLKKDGHTLILTQDGREALKQIQESAGGPHHYRYHDAIRIRDWK